MSTWKGTTAVKLQPTYPRFRLDAKGVTLTLVFRGPHSVLKTYGPDIGDMLDVSAFGYEPAGMIVFANSVDCQPDGGGDDGPGTLTVVYTNVPDSGALLANITETLEVDWSLVEKPLITHPRYIAGGANELTDEDRKKIDVWRAEPSTANYDACSTNAKHYIRKLRLGIESYGVPAPICRKTTGRTSAPTVSNCGQRVTSAPITGAPSGYQWLKTADRGVRSRGSNGWERVEEWTGAKTVDADLYTGVI